MSHDDPLARLIHDIRTPLTVIDGFAQLLERGDGVAGPDELAEYIGRIREGARDIRALLDAADVARTQP
jgi:signal transduction histidine kinase